MEEKDVEMHERVKGLEVSVEEIKNNHLVHLKETIDRVDERSWYILSAIILEFLVGIGIYLYTK